MRSGTAVLAGVFIVCLALASTDVQANPRPIDRPSTMELGQFFALLFSVNFFLNLFWYSLFVVLVLDWKGAGIARISQSRARFHLAVIVSVVFVTILGVIIDRMLLYEEDHGWLYFYYDGLKWAAAAGLVGLSVLAGSSFFMRMRPRYALLPAAGMMATNLFWWGLIGSSPFSESLCAPALFLVLVPLVLYELDKWHRREFGKAGGPSGVARHPDGV